MWMFLLSSRFSWLWFCFFFFFQIYFCALIYLGSICTPDLTFFACTFQALSLLYAFHSLSFHIFIAGHPFYLVACTLTSRIFSRSFMYFNVFWVCCCCFIICILLAFVILGVAPSSKVVALVRQGLLLGAIVPISLLPLLNHANMRPHCWSARYCYFCCVLIVFPWNVCLKIVWLR